MSQMGVQVSFSGPIPSRGLIVANHLSYLDVWVLSAITQCAFVAKKEVRSWPLVGWVARLAGTVFVDRSRPSQAHGLRPQIQQHLECGERLVLFPEGTSTGGDEVLPFHSSLFEAAIATATPVTAAHIFYELPDGDGDPATDVCYWGDMTLFPHLLKLLTKSNVHATVCFADQARVYPDRKQAAAATQMEVKQLGEARMSKQRAIGTAGF